MAASGQLQGSCRVPKAERCMGAVQRAACAFKCSPCAAANGRRKRYAGAAASAARVRRGCGAGAARVLRGGGAGAAHLPAALDAFVGVVLDSVRGAVGCAASGLVGGGQSCVQLFVAGFRENLWGVGRRRVAVGGGSSPDVVRRAGGGAADCLCQTPLLFAASHRPTEAVTFARECMHPRERTHVHAQAQLYVHTRSHTHALAHSHTKHTNKRSKYTHTHTHTYTHTHSHTHAVTHTHAYKHTPAWPCCKCQSPRR
jgi:hypothetical protein